VTEIIDGDTFYCIPKEKVTGVRIHKDGSISVRLYGIDAPEKDQPYGTEARNSLKELVKEKTVRLDVKDIDKYGRAVALVYVGSLNVNLEQVKRGFAWAYLEYLDSPYVSEYYSAEKEARSKGLGLWKQANPTPPWEWRKIKKYKEKVFTNEDLEKYYHHHATIYPESKEGSTYHREERYHQTDSKYVCGKKSYCFQMESCEEAMFYYTVCGLKRLDGDNDGVPCENLCGHH
jgi:endonuclease YncB( thermonuclease family)